MNQGIRSVHAGSPDRQVHIAVPSLQVNVSLRPLVDYYSSVTCGQRSHRRIIFRLRYSEQTIENDSAALKLILLRRLLGRLDQPLVD